MGSKEASVIVTPSYPHSALDWPEPLVGPAYSSGRDGASSSAADDAHWVRPGLPVADRPPGGGPDLTGGLRFA